MSSPLFRKQPGPRPGEGIPAHCRQDEPMKSGKTIYKVGIHKKDAAGHEQRRLEAPKDADGYYTREVKDGGRTIIYRKVA